MARYIDAEIAEKNIKETILGASEFAVDIRNAALECIRRTPAADVKEVVEGDWIAEMNKADIEMAIKQLKNDKRFIAEINLNKIMAYNIAINTMQKLLEADRYYYEGVE